MLYETSTFFTPAPVRGQTPCIPISVRESYVVIPSRTGRRRRIEDEMSYALRRTSVTHGPRTTKQVHVSGVMTCPKHSCI